MRAEKRTVQDDARVNGLHGACVFDKACCVLPCRKRTGFFPFAIQLVTDLPLLDVVLFDFVGVLDPSGGFFGGACARVYADNGVLSSFREFFDVGHEFFEMPLDACPVGARLVAIARGHREELVIVSGEQIVRAAKEFHFADLNAFGRKVGCLEFYGDVTCPRCRELVLGLVARDFDRAPSL